VESEFVVEAIKILFDAKSPLYPLVYKYILSRFAMKVRNDVPMWNECFFSEDAANIRTYRLWLLEILSRSASDKDSVELMLRRGVITNLLDGSISLNSYADELDHVLSIITVCCSEEVVRRYGLAQWINAVTHSRHVKFQES
jgi:hypothetical protein